MNSELDGFKATPGFPDLASYRAPLRTALAPRSVVVIGASDQPHKIGGRPIAYLSRFGFAGEIFPINPQRSVVQGLRSYPSLQDLPHAPDAAIVAVPGDLAVQAVSECARMGVRICVVMSSGFGESDPAGKLQEQAMRQVAHAHGMRIVGPNSQGLANFGTGAVLSFSTMFTEVPPLDGPIGIVSQSGAMSVIPYGLLRARGLGVRHAHATGNDCDMTVCELATVVAEDPDLKLLLLYLEGIPDPWHLAEAARVARDRNLPMVVLKSGRTPAGQQAAQSHTGALANEDRMVDAFFQEHGIMRVSTVTEMVDIAPLYLQGWRPKGRRLVAISNSGAVCVMTADAATHAAMPLQPLQEQTQAELRQILPGFATVKNPVDITAALLSNGRLFGDILPSISRDPAADAFLIGIAVAGAGYDVEAFARDTAAFATETGKPVLVAAPQPTVAEQFKALGQVVYPTETEAVHALGLYLTHLERMADAQARQPRCPSPQPALAEPSVLLHEADSMRLLQGAGVQMVQHHLCITADEMLQTFRNWGSQSVVLKGCTAHAAHKTELGLVRLNLHTEVQLEQAWADIAHLAQQHGVPLAGMILARMAQGERELMIGARRDPVFGPVVMIGDGGKYIEAMPDVQVLMAPFTLQQAQVAFAGLRVAPLAGGWRGDPPWDVDAFCHMACAIGQWLMREGKTVTQLDLNPVLIMCQGHGCQALDAVVLKGEAA
jgi:acetate---CoA ligase (ADP-forming)